MKRPYLMFDGKKFAYNPRTGYYLSTTKPRKGMHVYVWEYYNGPVPKGYEIHHKDRNKANNDISNLTCITIKEHRKLHGRLLSQETRDVFRKNMNENARPAAIEWHKSEAGKEWHKDHFDVSLKKAKTTFIEKTCEQCKKTYTVNLSNATLSKFCSKSCREKHRRLSGVDNVERICEYCGKVFKTNKYKPTKYCSRLCVSRAVTGSKRKLL